MKRGLFSFESQERCKETSCDTLHCGPASNTTENCGAVAVFLDSLSLSHAATFSDIKIYKDVHRVHFVTRVHKQSVSFGFKIEGLSEREKIFL